MGIGNAAYGTQPSDDGPDSWNAQQDYQYVNTEQGSTYQGGDPGAGQSDGYQGDGSGGYGPDGSALQYGMNHAGEWTGKAMDAIMSVPFVGGAIKSLFDTYQAVVDPMHQAMSFGWLVSNPLQWDNMPNLGKVWDESRNISPGQASALSPWNQLPGMAHADLPDVFKANDLNIYDPNARKALFPEDKMTGMNVVSGANDTVMVFFADPFVFAGKAVQVGRLRYLTRAADASDVVRADADMVAAAAGDWNPTKYPLHAVADAAFGDRMPSLVERIKTPIRNADTTSRTAVPEKASMDWLDIGHQDTIDPRVVNLAATPGSANPVDELLTTVADRIPNVDPQLSQSGWAVDKKWFNTDGSIADGAKGYRLLDDGHIAEAPLAPNGMPKVTADLMKTNLDGTPVMRADISVADYSATPKTITTKKAGPELLQHLPGLPKGMEVEAANFLHAAPTKTEFVQRYQYLRGSKEARPLVEKADPLATTHLETIAAHKAALTDELKQIALKSGEPGYTHNTVDGLKFRGDDVVTAADRLALPRTEAEYAMKFAVLDQLERQYGESFRLFGQGLGMPAYATPGVARGGVVGKALSAADRAAQKTADVLTMSNEASRAGSKTARAISKGNMYWFTPAGAAGAVIGFVHRMGDELPDHYVGTKGAAQVDAAASMRAIVRDHPLYTPYGGGRKAARQVRTWSDGTTMSGVERGRWLYAEWMRRANQVNLHPDIAYRDATWWAERQMWDDLVTGKGLSNAEATWARKQYDAIRAGKSKATEVKDDQTFFASVDPRTGSQVQWHDPHLASQLANGVQIIPFREAAEIMDSPKFKEVFRDGATLGDKASELAGAAKRGAVKTGDTVMGIWKPLVLLRPLSYPTRNVLEGQTRWLGHVGGLGNYLSAVFGGFSGTAKGSANIARRAFDNVQKDINLVDKAGVAHLDVISKSPTIPGQLGGLASRRAAIIEQLDKAKDPADVMKLREDLEKADKSAHAVLTQMGVIDQFNGDVALDWQRLAPLVGKDEAESLAGWANTIVSRRDLQTHASHLLDQVNRYDSMGRKVLRRGQGLQEFVDPETGRRLVYEEMFANPRTGDIMRSEVSGAATTEQYITSGQKAYMRALRQYRVEENKVVKPSDPNYYESLAKFANRHLRAEPVAKIIFEGGDDASARFLGFLKTDMGAKYREMFELHNARQAREQFSEWQRQIDALIPEQELRKALSRGDNITAEQAQAALSKAGVPLQPVVDTVSHELPGIANSLFPTLIRSARDKAFKWIGTMPEDFFTRMPFANDMYKRHMFDWLSRVGADITTDELRNGQALAARAAIRDTRDQMYTVMRKKRGFEAIRFVSAFAEAQYSTFAFWGRTLAANPQYIGRIMQVAEMPDKFGLVDDDGNISIPLPTFFTDHLPGKPTNATLSKEALLNLWFNLGNQEQPLAGGLLPSPSPFTTIAMSEFTKMPWGQDFIAWSNKRGGVYKKVADFALAQYTGDNSSALPMSVDKTAPAWLTKAMNMAVFGRSGGDGSTYMRQMQTNAWITDHIRWMMEGGKGKAPQLTDGKYRSAAEGMALLKMLVNVASPFGIQMENDNQRLATKLFRTLQEKDPKNAERVMMQQYPELVSVLSKPRSAGKVSGTPDTNRWILDNQSVIRKVAAIDPRMAKSLVPYDKAGEFSIYSYRWQEANKVPGQNEHWRQLVTPEKQQAEWEAKIGSALRYQRKEDLMIRAHQAGIEPGSPGYKAAVTDQLNEYTAGLKQRYRGFAESWSEAQNVDKGLDVMRAIIGDEKYRQQNPETVAVFNDYAHLRDKFVNANAGKYWDYPSNATMREDYATQVDRLALRDPLFSDVYDRYFSYGDKMTTRFDGGSPTRKVA